MNRYWDLSERERSKLTDEQVEAMLAVELMEKGVSKVEQPVLLPVEFTKPKSERMFVVKRGYGTDSMAYPTAELAQQAMENGVWLDHEYIGGEYVYKRGQGFLTIETVEVCDPADVARLKSDNDKATANKKANDEATKAYNSACEAVTEACSGVWEDYRECQAKARRYQKIIDTLGEYTTICDDDEDKAEIFLGKAYPATEILAAKTWFGMHEVCANP